MSKSVEQAQAALDAANAAYLAALERESNRTDGSDVQEGRREARLQSLQDAIAQCESDLAAAIRAQAGGKHAD